MSNQPQVDRLEESIEGARAGHSNYSEDDWRLRLEAFLRAQGVGGKIGEIKRPDGGASAASVIFTLEKMEQGSPVKHRYVARMQPERSFFKVFDTVEQFTVQQYLHGIGLPVPAALWLDAEGEYLGRPAYIMEFATGSGSTPAYFNNGPLSNISTEQRFRMIRNLICTMADFHGKSDPWAVKSLSTKGRGETWIERKVNLWFDLVEYSRPELISRYEPIRDWLVDAAPQVQDPVLVHGDFHGANVLWNGEEVCAILDFEAVHVGPRETDLAYQCCFDEVSAKFFCGLDIELPSLTQRAAWYEEASGIKLTNLDYHLTRVVFQLVCGGVSLAREAEQDLAVEPTPFMDYINRRLLTLLPKSLPFEPNLPLIRR